MNSRKFETNLLLVIFVLVLALAIIACEYRLEILETSSEIINQTIK
jgi:hypothetical protein